MPKQVKNKSIYLAINVSETPEDRGLALKVIRQFAEDQGAPEEFDFGGLVDQITGDKAWIIKHDSGNVTFVTPEQYEGDFEEV